MKKTLLFVTISLFLAIPLTANQPKEKRYSIGQKTLIQLFKHLDESVDPHKKVTDLIKLIQKDLKEIKKPEVKKPVKKPEVKKTKK